MDIYTKNIESIKKIAPDLVAWINKEDKIEWFEIIKSRNGDDNLLISQGGKKGIAFNIENPQKEPKELAKNIPFSSDTATIILGSGFGYLVKAIIDKMEEGHKVVLVEPIPQLLQLMFSKYDFSKNIEKGDLIIVAPNEENIALSLMDSVYVISDWNFISEKYTHMRNLEYDKSFFKINETINQLKCNIGTVMGAGREIARNDIINLPYIIRHRGVNELKEIFKNKPSVLIGTGPSLAKNIHRLKEYQNNVIIIAVGQALRPLLAYNIRPDFICTVDYGKTNIGHYKGLLDSDVPLVCLNRTYALLLKKWKGTKFISSTPVPGFDNTVSGFIQKKGFVEQGGSVIHMCFGLSQLLGCSPSIIIGMDLSFENTSHIPLADESGIYKVDNKGNIKWEIKDPRSHLLRKKDYGMGEVVKIPGYFGEHVNTNAGLASFLTSLQSMIKNCGKLIINSNEGGARIEGTKLLPLKNALEKYADKKIDKTEIQNLSTLIENPEDEIKKIIPIVNSDIKNLKKIIKNSINGLKEIEIMKITADEDELEQALTKNEEYSKAAHDAAKKNSLVGVSIYYASRMIFAKEFNVDKERAKNLSKDKEALNIRIKRSELILTAAQKESEELLKHYKTSLKILKKYIKTKDESILISQTPEIPSIKDADKFFKIGNFARPYLEAKKILESEPENKKAKEVLNKAILMREEKIKEAEAIPDINKVIEYNELIDKSRNIGREEDFEKAIKYAEKAYNIDPTRFEAVWGLATCYHQIYQTTKAIEFYEKLIQIKPDNLRFKFEYGCILLHENIEKGICVIKEVMKQTNEFDYYFLYLGNLYFSKEIFDKAIDCYKEYLTKFPAVYETWDKLGECYQRINQLQEAKKCFAEARKIKGETNV